MKMNLMNLMKKYKQGEQELQRTFEEQRKELEKKQLEENWTGFFKTAQEQEWFGEGGKNLLKT